MLTLQELIELLTEDPDYKLPSDATPEEVRNYNEAKKRVLGLNSGTDGLEGDEEEDDLGFESSFDEESESEDEENEDDDEFDDLDDDDLTE